MTVAYVEVEMLTVVGAGVVDVKGSVVCCGAEIKYYNLILLWYIKVIKIFFTSTRNDYFILKLKKN